MKALGISYMVRCASEIALRARAAAAAATAAAAAEESTGYARWCAHCAKKADAFVGRATGGVGGDDATRRDYLDVRFGDEVIIDEKEMAAFSFFRSAAGSGSAAQAGADIGGSAAHGATGDALAPGATAPVRHVDV